MFRFFASLTSCIALTLLLVACNPPETAQTTPQAVGHPTQTISSSVHTATASRAVPVSTPSAMTDSCRKAQEVLVTCAYETTCNPDMTMYLPAAARDVLVTLEKAAGFNSGAFGRYCEHACNAKSRNVDEAAFAREVCKPESKELSNAQTAAIAGPEGIHVVVKADLVIGVEPVELAKVLRLLGKPHRIVKSPYQCDSAFESEGTKLYEYDDFRFESDGKLAVLRMVTPGPWAMVVVPGWPPSATLTYSRLKSLPGFTTLNLTDDTLRIAPKVGASLESAYDFKFKGDRLLNVKYWIGC